MASNDAIEALKAFLESTPPNTPKRIPGLAIEVSALGRSGRSHWEVTAPKRLQLHCDVDDGVRRFDAVDTNNPGSGLRFLDYVCRDCSESRKTYALLAVLKRVNDEVVAEVMKLGEYPPFGAPISTRIQKLLGKDDLAARGRRG